MLFPAKHNGYYIYVHIPFCKKKCSYCYYNSFVINDSLELPDQYILYLKKELQLRTRDFDLFPVDVLYFGGGTPSYLSLTQLKNLFNILKEYFDLSQLKEFTIEVNPASCTLGQLKLFKKIGVTRLSFGIQTLNKEILKYVNRYFIEDPSKIILEAKKLGFNINLDFISGLPYQTTEDIDGDSAFIKKIHPNLCTMHELRIGTDKMLAEKRKKGIFFGETHKLYQRFANKLKEMEYLQFAPELFSFKKNMPLCNYGNNWWAKGKIFGIGISAFSQINDYLTINTNKINTYFDRLNNNKLPTGFSYKFDMTELAVMNFASLLTAGFIVDIKEIKKIYNVNIISILEKEIKELIMKKYIFKKGEGLYLNNKKFTFSTPLLKILLERFDYLGEVWDKAGGAPDKFRYSKNIST